MIKKIITYSAHHPGVILLMTLFALLAGIYSLKHIPIDAVPDLSDTQVIIYSKWDRSPDLIENQVTYPLISGLLGTPKVKSIRGLTDFGFSYVYVIFDEGTDLYWARTRVLEYLSRVTPSLPVGVKTELGPDATSVGWVYQYVLQDTSAKLDSSDLRTLQDFTLKFQLQSVPGVAEVAAVGGFQKQIQIQVDPAKLQAFHVTFEQVMKAVRESNQQSGGRVLEFSGTEAMVRSRGLTRDVSDIESSVVSFDSRTRASVTVKEIATVSFGPELRRGVSDFNGQGDTVGGIIVMRQGEDTPQVIKQVKAKIAELAPGLPQGVKIIPVYDRSDLIHRAIETLKHTLIEEMLIVSLIILIFLWHIPSAVIPILTIPVAVLLAFIPLYFSGQSSNIMSLAGIAISIGVLVDGAIVEVENAYRKIQHWDAGGRKEDFHQVRLQALLEVGPSVFFSLLVIAVAFLPIFTLVDQEGRLFRPLAMSKNFTMAIAAILAITLDPALRMLFSRAEPFQLKYNWLNRIANTALVGKYYEEHRHPVSKRLFQIYEPAVRWVLHHYKKTLITAGLLTLTIIPGYLLLGSEFMPTLHEGSLLYMPTAQPGLSVSEARRILRSQDQIIKSFPEVETVFGKAGRADTSTDTAPLSMVETTIQLKPRSEWRQTRVHFLSIPLWNTSISEEALIDEMNSKLTYPGMPNIWTMPIKNRIDMLSTGIRSAVGVKVSGPDLKVIEQIGKQIENKVKSVSGARTVVAERAGSGYFVDVDFDRSQLANYGLTLKNAQDQAMAAIGGENVSVSLSGRERYPIQVRLNRDSRSDIESLQRVLISTPAGSSLPLGTLAKIQFSEGPSMVRDENAMPVGYVFIDVDQSARDIGSFVDEAKEKVLNEVKVPAGYFITWSGQFENMARVKERLKIVVPLTLLLILFLLHFNTGSWVKTGIVLLAIPFSLIGAVWFMWILGYHSSIASWVGMIALLGLDAETGVFMLMYLDLAYDERVKEGRMNQEEDLIEGIIEGAVHRIRPKMMTVCALMLGLTPILWSMGAGADVMKRIAAPMIGGLLTSFILELLIYPVLFFRWKSPLFKKSI
ncbi:MAG: efflux RND transporter permease subunit [Bdellovibrionales bacterium]|nr:efflux RND transporter permease subunit [Oligoflexia bacterium]